MAEKQALAVRQQAETYRNEIRDAALKEVADIRATGEEDGWIRIPLLCNLNHPYCSQH